MKNQTLIGKHLTTQRTCFKSIFVLLVLFTGLMPFKSLQAQVNVSVNIVSQPLWGPVGYDYVDYYYLPEAEVYYYVPTARFFYLSSGRWVYSTYLPTFYHIDLYNTYKVVVNEPRPYLSHHVYVAKYGKYKTYKGKQVIIRNSDDKKYYVVKGHPGAKVKTVKPKSAKPANAKSGNVKPKSSKPSSAKPRGGNPSSSKPSNAKPGGSKHNSTAPNSSKGNSSKGKGGKGK